MTYLATEVPIENPGMAFRSKVRVQPIDQNTVAVKIQDFEIAKHHCKKHDWTDDSKLEFTKYEKFSEIIEKPFIVETIAEEGIIGNRVSVLINSFHR